MAREHAFTALLAIAMAPTAGCHRQDDPLGPADSYLIYELAAPGAPATAPRGGTSLPLFRDVRLDDPRAMPIHRVTLEGFVGELVRTDYLAKQLLRDGWKGRPFSAMARARATEPTIMVLGGSRMARADEATLGVGFTTTASFGRVDSHRDAMWIETGDNPVADPAFVQTASGRVARLVAERIAGAADTPQGQAGASIARPLVDGFALAMEVIGREWRVGEGPQGTLPPSAGTGTQRERFAGVRGNAFVMVPGDPGTLRPGAEMLSDPGVIATVIHRMAQATGVGRRIAPPEIYGPFVSQRVPPGVSPAAVLGPIRNFQVKLLCAWAGAILAGHPPRDLADLVSAYAEVIPAERADLHRIFVATTYGATVKAGGVSPRAADADKALPELMALAAEVTTGRRSLRQAIAP